jgi:hypothetical protein
VVTAVNTEGEKSEDSLASPVVAAPLSAAPANTALPTITDSSGNGYHVGDALTATEGTWLGTTPVAYSYQWQRCNSSGGNCSSIVGATASSYVLASADVGFTLRVNVAAENSNGHGSASSAVTPKVTATTVIAPPTNNAKPTILGSPKVGSILSAEHGTWSGATPITYSYQWLDCREGSAPSENSCVAVLVGGTSASYRVTTSDEGNDLAVLVTATNPGGSSSVYSSSTVVVGLQSSLETTASKPVNKTLPTIKGKDKRKSKLTASTGTWTGTAPITYQYQWGLCVKSKRKGKIIVTCRAIKGATKPTLAVSPKYVNDRLRVVVTATNAAGKVSVTSKETGVIKK